MKTLLVRLILPISLFGFAAAANATPIVYTITGFASGTLGANSFNNAAITFTQTADTSTVSGGGGTYLNDGGNSTVSVAGLGTATITTGSYGILDFQGWDLIAFYDTTSGFAFGTMANPFASYTAQSLLDPVQGSPLAQGDEMTSLGDLTLSTLSSNATFSANAPAPTPESGSLSLVALGTLTMSGLLKWRSGSRSKPAQSM